MDKNLLMKLLDAGVLAPSPEEQQAIDTAVAAVTLTQRDGLVTLTLPSTTLPLLFVAQKLATITAKGADIPSISRTNAVLGYLIATAADADLGAFLAIGDQIGPVSRDLLKEQPNRYAGYQKIQETFNDVADQIVHATKGTI